MESDTLRRAYDLLFAEIDAGGFAAAPPGDGHLSAEEIVAHLVINDELMIEASEAVLVGSNWADYDLDAVHRPQLAEMVRRCAGFPGLTTAFHATSDRLCSLATCLGAAAGTPVHTHLEEGLELSVDEALPWGRVLDLHGRVHLPMHLAQLRALRP
ncbi:hypothetical protein [Melissospora conviva]|uniref:hypothetical protein n=1 Tax=Melissospora conviva TaxID=3388432 RepID=UPI003B7EE4A7